ncbi:hypothetical protein HN680_07775, partial [Candidatus Peregrinibacteria bacterium]|nr:hypothetical protein [Candidatus Peregrinibacteria bacterium]
MQTFKKFVASASIATILSLGIPVSAMAEGEDLSDLFIDAITVSEAGMLSFTASNIGTLDVDPALYDGVNYVYVDDFDTPAYELNWSDHSDQAFLMAGGSSTFEISELYGEHQVMVCLDATDVVADEADENNNCAVVYFYADLEVTNVYLNGAGDTLSIDVTNNGTGAIDPTTEGHTTIYTYVDGVEDDHHAYSWPILGDKNFLTPGGTSTIQIGPLTGEHTVVACVDAYEVVDESDETNNCLEVEFTPDLYINDITLDGNSQLLTVEMGNQGDVAVDPDTELGTTFIYIDDMTDPVYTYNWETLADTDFLEVGGLSELSPAVLNGSHTVMACIDAREMVNESDETNNCMTVTFQADLVLENVYLEEGTDKLTIQVSNQGNTSVDLETEDGFTYIYIDDMNDPAYTYKWSNLNDQDFLEIGGVSELQPLVMDESHTVYACVDATDVVDESDETNNCMEVTFEADLAVTDVYLDNGVLTTELSNLGTLDVDPESGGRVYIYVDDMESPLKNYDWSLLNDQAFLEVGGVSELQSHSLDSNVHDVMVCVDPTDVVAETDEENNCMEVTFGADLTVTDVYLSGTLLSIDLANLGNIDVDPTETQGSIFIYVDDMETPEKTYNWNTLANNDFLDAGGTSTMQPMNLEEGAHDIYVCVDATDVVTETDETNNCFEITLGPDLTVTDVYEDESGLLSVDLTNIGTVDVSGSTVGYVYIYIDDLEDAKYKYNWTMLDDDDFLNVGEVSTIQPMVLDGEEHTIMACVDATDTVAELDEDNNCVTSVFGAPDLTVNDIYLDESNVLTAEMTNIGSEDVLSTTDGQTTLYVDDMDTPQATYNWQDLADQAFMEVGGVTLLQPLVFAPDSGTREIKVCMDSSEIVSESDETNNCLQVTVDTDTGTGEPTTDGPDLTVNDIYLDESNILTAEMANIGGEAVPSETDGQTTLYVDDMETPAETYNWQDLGDQTFLEAGGISYLQPLVFEPATADREVMICMDSSDVVSESDETNNCLQVTIALDDGGGDD